MGEQLDMWVDRADFHRVQVNATRSHADPGAGRIRLAIDQFALTANNVSYATLGDTGGFWQMFPAPAPWGSVPVWGFAEVVASRHAEIAVGQRVFGFLPMASHVVLQPGRVTRSGFTDAAAHRDALFPIYNYYARWASGPAFDAQREDLHAVVRPLFFTSFVLDDQLAAEGCFGARTVLMSSASSKTALGTAFLLRARRAVQVVGLTAARHRAFVDATGCFDAVHSYDEVGALVLEPPVVYVDFSGDTALRRAVHERLGAMLVHSLKVGTTHGAARADDEAPPGPAVQAFFGPVHIRKRRSEWGAELLLARCDAAEARFLEAAADWLQIERRHGAAEVAQAWRDLLQGRATPDRAFICRVAADAPASLAEEGAALSFLRPSGSQ